MTTLCCQLCISHANNLGPWVLSSLIPRSSYWGEVYHVPGMQPGALPITSLKVCSLLEMLHVTACTVRVRRTCPSWYDIVTQSADISATQPPLY